MKAIITIEFNRVKRDEIGSTVKEIIDTFLPDSTKLELSE